MLHGAGYKRPSGKHIKTAKLWLQAPILMAMVRGIHFGFRLESRLTETSCEWWVVATGRHGQADAALLINDKTKILVKGITAAEAHAAAQRLLADHPSLAHLGPLLTPKSFVDDGYIGLGVPIGTDAFIQDFVVKKCKNIMEDVDKLDNIQDCFIHYQLLRFCQATRLQYLNGQVQLANQQVLQQQNGQPRASCAAPTTSATTTRCCTAPTTASRSQEARCQHIASAYQATQRSTTDTFITKHN